MSVAYAAFSKEAVVADGQAGGPTARRTPAISLRAISLPTVGAVGLGLLAGSGEGAWYGYWDSTPTAGSVLPPTLLPILAGGLLVVGLAVVGVLLSLAARSRPAGRLAFMALLGVVGGIPFGILAGPRYQPPQILPGTVSLELVEPIGASLTGPGTCTTVANGNQVLYLEALDLGPVGIDRLSFTAHLQPAPTIDIRVNGTFAYAGAISLSDTGIDGVSGHASFTAAAGGAVRLGGPSGGATAAGTVSWNCQPPALGAPTLGVSAGPVLLQGYFKLEGIVEAAEARATGACSRALDLRTDAIETVVTWVDGRQARLRITPGRETAALTVEFGDGSAPETATAPATLVELVGGVEGSVSTRRLDAVFELPDGRLAVFVEWECGDSVR